jgi:hypothetical protein
VLIALPIAVFVVITILLHSHRSDLRQGAGWCVSLLLATIIWGTLLIGITEGLSLFKAITRSNVAVLWSIALAALILVGRRKGSFRLFVSSLKKRGNWRLPDEWPIVIAMGAILAALGLIAWIAPPNTTDSLLYHLARVAHWIQGSSLAHYPTAYQHQLWAPPFTEMSVLNLLILWGNDQPVNMVQWFSLLGSIIGVTAVAKLIGGKLRGQFLTTAFTISIPMAILQATSTQTDLVTGYWLICSVYLVLLSKVRSLSGFEEIALGLSVGLGFLTKGTFYPLVLPIMAWYFFPILKGKEIKVVTRRGITMGVLVLLLNGGFWLRNISTFDGPLGPKEAISQHTELSLDPGGWISTVLRHIARNFASPSAGANEMIASAVDSIQSILGITREKFTLIWAWNQEDYAGSPIHLIVLIGVIVGALILSRRMKAQLLKEYTWVYIGSALLFGIVVQASLFSNRLQLPVFIMGAPLAGVILSQLKSKRLNNLLIIGFLILSIPWVLFNSTRPVIAMRPGQEPWGMPCVFGCTRTGSVFFRSREDLIFANWPEFQVPIMTIADRIESDGCKQVGLALDSRDREYLFWWSLDALDNGIDLQSITTVPDLEKYLDPTYAPCAVICTICRFRTEAFGLDLGYNRQLLSLFLGDGFKPVMDP